MENCDKCNNKRYVEYSIGFRVLHTNKLNINLDEPIDGIMYEPCPDCNKDGKIIYNIEIQDLYSGKTIKKEIKYLPCVTVIKQ